MDFFSHSNNLKTSPLSSSESLRKLTQFEALIESSPKENIPPNPFSENIIHYKTQINELESIIIKMGQDLQKSIQKNIKLSNKNNELMLQLEEKKSVKNSF